MLKINNTLLKTLSITTTIQKSKPHNISDHNFWISRKGNYCRVSDCYRHGQLVLIDIYLIEILLIWRVGANENTGNNMDQQSLPKQHISS